MPRTGTAGSRAGAGAQCPWRRCAGCSGFPQLYSGLLCTIDLRNDPVRTYQALTSFAPPKIDFMLPHGTWTAPPPGRDPDPARTPYADWLIEVFDHWYPKPLTRNRLFEEIMQLLLGGASDSEAVGLAPARMVVIETDGTVEQVDTLKVAFAGATATGLHVASNPLDVALLLPQMAARQIGSRALSAQCRVCPIHAVCGAACTTGSSPTQRCRASTSSGLAAAGRRGSG
jgi:uncharacterized protein